MYICHDKRHHDVARYLFQRQNKHSSGGSFWGVCADYRHYRPAHFHGPANIAVIECSLIWARWRTPRRRANADIVARDGGDDERDILTRRISRLKALRSAAAAQYRPAWPYYDTP